MSQYGFYFNGPRCTGCKTCELACKDYHDLTPEIAFRNVYEYTGGTWSQDGLLWSEDVYSYYISGACNHCDMPACMANCAQGAISKDQKTGIVAIDAEKCIGCGLCIESCPYGAPKLDEEKSIAVKCDMCAGRVAEGLVPICVEACPLRALEFGEIEELRSKYGDVAAVAPLPDSSKTNPNVVMTEPRHSKPVGDETGALANAIEVV